MKILINNDWRSLDNMKIGANKIRNNKPDDELYQELINFLAEIKILQGSTSLNSTINRHKKVKLFLYNKQKQYLNDFEETFLNEDGSADIEAIEIALVK